MTKSQKMNAAIAATLLALSGSSLAAATATTVTGGQVHFTGSVVDAACSVDTSSADQTVQMGQVRVAKFGTTSGTLANQKVPFAIELADCDTTTVKNAAITFAGNGASGSPSVLDNTAGPGSAVGVGIQLYDNAGKALALGTLSPVTTLINGANSLKFSADYISTATAVKAGDVNATATFNVTYS